MSKRFWEIDFFRGITILLMVIFNYAFTLKYFEIYTLDLGEIFWWVFPRFIVASFCVISGVALVASYNEKKNFVHYLLRSAQLFFWAAVITLVTFYAMQNGTVVFGILHFMAVAGILAYLFLKYKINNLTLVTLAIVIILIGAGLSSIYTTNDVFMVFGLRSAEFHSLDYEPLLPWFGFVLLGIFTGRKLYENGERKTNRTIGINENDLLSRVFCFLGKNSLAIYILHQPILIVLLLLTGTIMLG